jgi:aconitate hydratase
MQDFTGVGAIVDIAAMRDALKDAGKNPEDINPVVPTDLVVDHSIQVDYFGTTASLRKNVACEYKRNIERYELLKWGQKNFNNFRVVPPNSGICHQVNLEYLGKVLVEQETDGRIMVYPDTLVGTDSHTPMINGIGVLGWGVGGIEAEAVMLGQPYYMSIPEVIGVKITGALQKGCTATDLVLTVTELLRQHKVVEKFVEYFGPGLDHLRVPDRATLSNMAPEYGATVGFFPIDRQTIEYLEMTSRKHQADIVRKCASVMGLFYDGQHDPEYTKVIELDLAKIQPCLAGPSRPQDRIVLTDLKHKTQQDENPVFELDVNGNMVKIRNHSVVIAAITSCTNTSNPSVLVGAGLVAKKAVEKGLKVPAYVKTSMAPGSKVVMKYLEDSALLPYLEALGFHCAGFGCTTCIGNSGPLHLNINKVIDENNLSVAAVLSGNRNFSGRIQPKVKESYLMSPMLVVAFAIAGRIDIDFDAEPVACDPNGEPVYLRDLWPDSTEIEQIVATHVKTDSFSFVYDAIFTGDDFWEKLDVGQGATFNWNRSSTYIKCPPYFQNFSLLPEKTVDIVNARALGLFGDSFTTDHISPAGQIAQNYPSGKYLMDNHVQPEDFNSYGSRRGNHEVMIRGTFGNIRIKNRLVSPKEGGLTIKYPEKKEMFIYDASVEYGKENIPLIVIGGKEYGTGSSRDWAAKGTQLLGVKAVIAESFERIHRNNLVGMGVLPLVFKAGDSAEKLGIDGSETFSISGIADIEPGGELEVKMMKEDGSSVVFQTIARLDSSVEVAYFNNGGILAYVLRKMISK